MTVAKDVKPGTLWLYSGYYFDPDSRDADQTWMVVGLDRTTCAGLVGLLGVCLDGPASTHEVRLMTVVAACYDMSNAESWREIL